MTPWLTSEEGLVNGNPVNCTPVTPPFLLPSPITLDLQPTLANGRCWWFAESGPFDGITPYSSISLEWQTGRSIPDSWVAFYFNFTEPAPGNPLIQQTQYSGPPTDDPPGTYVALKADDTPSTCADPLTVDVA